MQQNPNLNSTGIFEMKASYEDVYFNNVDEFYLNNTAYGNAKVLRDYSGYNHPLPCSIEHGLYFGDYVLPADYKVGFKHVITYSDYRKKIIEKATCCDAHPIGPYICYADELFDIDVISDIRSDFGKTISVFPAHSIESCKVKYDVDSLLRAIDTIRLEGHFDTVIVCLSYRDLGLASYYKSHGYKVTCIGNGRDPLFLSKLKSLFSVTDLSISNSVGTNLGYSIACGVPYFCYMQDYYHEGNLDDINTEGEEATAELIEAFSTPTQEISSKQMDIVNRYFGLESVMGQQEMRALFESFYQEA